MSFDASRHLLAAASCDVHRDIAPLAMTCQLPLQAALHRYLRTHVKHFPAEGSLQVYQFSHGQSNPTYLVKVSHTPPWTHSTLPAGARGFPRIRLGVTGVQRT